MTQDIEFSTARTLDEVEALRDAWEELGVSYIDSEHEYFCAFVADEPELRPHVVVGRRDGRPVALLVAHVSRMPFAARIGYRSVYRPTLSTIRVMHGGVSGTD